MLLNIIHSLKSILYAKEYKLFQFTLYRGYYKEMDGREVIYPYFITTFGENYPYFVTNIAGIYPEFP